MSRSIRPLTLRRIIETADLASQETCLDVDPLSHRLGVRKRRARDILLELAQMHLLSRSESSFTATDVARKVLAHYKREDWHSIHKILYEHHDFYRLLIDTLSNSPVALSKEELLQRLSTAKHLNFNITAIDTVCDWAERLGTVQRNLYTNRYYLLSRDQSQNFAFETQRCYDKLNVELRPGLKLEYVEIARLREDVCERLRIARELFDKAFESMVHSMVGKIDLCGAPVTTTAKRIPSTLKIIERNGKQPILSPKYSVIKEGKGVEISGRVYHYVAFFDGGE